MEENSAELDWSILEDDNPDLSKQLESFETNLTCPICQEFFDNPQILKCGHSFCSLCLRKHMDATINRTTSNLCPFCKEKAETFDLRKNIHLSILVDQFKTLRSTLFQELTNSNSNNSTNSSSFTDYSQIKGAKILSKVPQPHLHGLNKEKARKILDEIIKSSRIKLRIDGDKDILERRIRELIHQMNAQVDSDHPLSLDAVIKKVNDEEGNILFQRNKSSFSDNIVQSKNFSKSFGVLTQKALASAKNNTQNNTNTSQQEDKNDEEEEQEEELQHKTPLGKKPPTRNQNSSSNTKNNDKDNEDKWAVLYSDELNRPFYFNLKTKMGQFAPPTSATSLSFVDSAASNSSPIPFSNNGSPFGEIGALITSNSSPQALEKNSLKAINEEQLFLLDEDNDHQSPVVPMKEDEEDPLSFVESSSNNNKWSCEACTFLNDNALNKCEMCFNERKTLRRSQRTSHVGSSSNDNLHNRNILSDFPSAKRNRK